MEQAQGVIYKPHQFAKMVGCSVGTLQRWDRQGVLTANRTLTNRRYYTYHQYLEIVKAKHKKQSVN